MSEKAYIIEYRIMEGTMAPNFFGQIDFMPNMIDDKDYKWSRVLTLDLNSGISEIVAILNSKKE